ncbi:MAG: ABC transporter permease subunit, partial [Actinobacteria bacterium]|nr:ABC transporter permease subunit [Actinomycetota bacterium]
MSALVIARQRLRVYRHPLAIWTASLAVLGGLTVLLWPSVRDASGLEELVAGLPEAFRALIGARELTSPEGFLNSRLASIFPLLITVYAAFRVADEVAGEEQRGGFEIVLGHPLGRSELLLGTAAAVAVSVAVLMTGTGLAMSAAGSLVDIGIPVGRMLAATTALTLLGWSSLGIALAVAGVTGRRGLTLGIGV